MTVSLTNRPEMGTENKELRDIIVLPSYAVV